MITKPLLMTSPPKYNVNKNRSLHFQIGLVVSIFVVLFLFELNFKSEHYEVDQITEWEDSLEPLLVMNLLINPKKVIQTKTVKSKDPSQIDTEVSIITKPTIAPVSSRINVIFNPVLNSIPKPISVPIRQIAEKKKDKAWDIVEHMPIFGDCISDDKSVAQDCSDRALRKYLAKNIRYPAIAKEIGLEGRVVVQLVIDEKGRVSDPLILRDPGGGCGDEVLRVVRKMPDWAPGFQYNRKVKVRLRIPVSFTLD